MANIETSSAVLSDEIITAIEDIKGEEIVKLDLRNIDNSVADFFVVCSGGSNTHTSSIAQFISKEVSKKLHEKPFKTEGQQNAEWVLMDYGTVVVHVFQRHIRDFYQIEELWSDAERTDYEDTI
jgi:ribosome-associated protein